MGLYEMIYALTGQDLRSVAPIAVLSRTNGFTRP